MSSLIPHDYRYKISSPTPVDKEPIYIIYLPFNASTVINGGYPFHTGFVDEPLHRW